MSAPTIDPDHDVDEPVDPAAEKKAAKAARKQALEDAVAARKAELLDQRTKAELRAQSKRAKAASKRGEKVDLLDEKQMRASLSPECEKEASRQVKREARRAKLRAAWDALKLLVSADVASAVHRNRAQLPPALAFLAYALAGVVTVAFATSAPSQVGTSALLGGLVAVVTWWAWTRGFGKKRPALRGRVPEAHRHRARIALAIWTACVPAAGLIAPSHHLGTIALVAVVTLLWAAVPWWNAVAHPIPDKNATDNEEPPAPQPAAEPDQLDADQKRIMGVLNAWPRVAKTAVKGSEIEYHSSTEYVDSYLIRLNVDGEIVPGNIDGLKDKIAMKVGIPETELSFEKASPSTVWMRHKHGSPAFDYTGPIVYADGVRVSSRWEIPVGAEIEIVVGHYIDGTGDVVYRLTDEAGVFGGFVLGGTGSGKTVFMNVLAIALRMLGVHIVYVDGQDGASSPVLLQHAARSLTKSADDLDEFRHLVNEFRRVRNQQLTDDNALENPKWHGGYQYDPHRPPVVFVIDEFHEITNAEYEVPGSGKSRKRLKHGPWLGDVASEIRKLGGGVIGLSQDFDLDTFGGSARLRNSMLAGGNLFTLLLDDRSRIGMLPKSTPDLTTLPGKGHGYKPKSDRPDGEFRSLDVAYNRKRPPKTDLGQKWPTEWMAEYPADELDSDTASAMYGPRPVTTAPAEQVDELFDASPEPVVVPLFGQQADEPTDADVQAAAVLGVEPISESERALLDALGWDGRARSATTVGENLGISRPAAQKRLERAAEKGLVARLEDRKWINRKKENETL